MASFKSVKIRAIRYFFTFCTILFGHYTHAQLLNVDSCINVLKTAKEDTNKIILLDEIAWEISYTNLQKGIDYCHLFLVLLYFHAAQIVYINQLRVLARKFQ